MIAKELISGDVLPLKTSDTGLTTLHWFDEFKVSHLPVVSDSQLLGLVSEADIYAEGSFEEPIWSLQLQLQNISILQSKHIYEAMKLFADYKLTTLPVVDEKGTYLGVITLADIVEKMAATAAVSNPGGILVLDLNANDFSMVEISRIIEDNDAKMLSFYVTSPIDSTRLELTLKLNKIDIQPVIQSFLRHNYTIKASFFESDYFDNLRERYDLLMTYLNV
ncbi:MAG: CBS domain-containing protein [Bacteroidota bacterium]